MLKKILGSTTTTLFLVDSEQHPSLVRMRESSPLRVSFKLEAIIPTISLSIYGAVMAAKYSSSLFSLVIYLRQSMPSAIAIAMLPSP